MSAADAPETVQGSCVAVDGRALLVLGSPGAGKSALALDLIALGAALVADDLVALRRLGAGVAASAVRRAGVIEARGVGLLRMPAVAQPVRLALALDLDRAEGDRLPQRRSVCLLGASVPFLLRPEPLRPSAVLACLRHGPPLDPDAPLEG